MILVVDFFIKFVIIKVYLIDLLLFLIFYKWIRNEIYVGVVVCGVVLDSGDFIIVCDKEGCVEYKGSNDKIISNWWWK